MGSPRPQNVNSKLSSITFLDAPFICGLSHFRSKLGLSRLYRGPDCRRVIIAYHDLNRGATKKTVTSIVTNGTTLSHTTTFFKQPPPA